MHIVNFTQRDQRLLQATLQLRYETTPEEMRYILPGCALLLGHPMVTPDPARVRFTGYGAYSKDVEIFAHLRCQDQKAFLAIQEDILLRVEDIIRVAGSGFAFPSQTTYLTRDAGLDAELTHAAEAEVENWRAVGKRPFRSSRRDSASRSKTSSITRRRALRSTRHAWAGPVSGASRRCLRGTRWPAWTTHFSRFGNMSGGVGLLGGREAVF